MKEIILSFYDSIKNRFKSPFVGSYIVSFIVYNWWPISIYLKSDEKIEDVVSFLTKNYSTPWAYLVPLIFAFAYIIAIPYLNAFFDWVGTRASLFRIKHRNKVKHESLLLDIKTAEYERRIADERAGTTERQALLRKVEDAEAKVIKINDQLEQERAEFKFVQEELAIKINDINNENLKLRNDVGSLNSVNSSLRSEVAFYHGIYPYLIKIGKNSRVELQQFLKKYINDVEIVRLKEDVIAQGQHDKLFFRDEVNALMYYSGIYEFDQKNNFFYLTESGARFIQNML